MITLEQAKALTYRQVIFHNTLRDSKGNPSKWRVNGMVKTWVRSPERVKVPLKHGMWDFGYLTEDNLDELSLTEEEALGSD
jgi:hypothetical protein